MIYKLVLLCICVIAFSVGIKSLEAGLTIAIGGSICAFLIREFINWDAKRAASKWERSKEAVIEARLETIRSQFFNSGIRIFVDATSKPRVFAARYDAKISAFLTPYSLLKIDELYFLLSGIDSSEKEKIANDYIAQEFGLGNGEINRNSMNLSAPSAAAIETQFKEEKNKKEETQRLLAARLVDIENRTPVDLGEHACCLYIMVSNAVVKIGISNRPDERLRQVQTGHPEKLRLHKVWWFQSSADAMLVERTIHALLKVRGSHASGEWFKMKATDGVQVASGVIQNLSATNAIDKGLMPKINAPLSQLELTLGKLLNQPWSLSKKGNEYLRLPDHVLTVFRRKRSWSYLHNEVFSEDQFPTKEAAKAAVLRQVLVVSKKN